MSIKVKIINTTGNPAHTEILDAETGQRIEYVMSAHLYLSREENSAHLNFLLTPFDIVVDAIIDNTEEVRQAIARHEKRLKELHRILGE